MAALQTTELKHLFLLPAHKNLIGVNFELVDAENREFRLRDALAPLRERFNFIGSKNGYDAPGLAWYDRFSSRWIIGLGRRFPQLFFLFVLGGEDPIDYVQRRELRSNRDKHPLLERIMRIHVTEEARHLSFARHYLKRTVPALGPIRRAELAIGAPLILGAMAQLMLKPSPNLVRRYGIPQAVVDEAYNHNPRHHTETLASLGKVRKLCEDLGLVRRPYTALWRKLGLDAR